MASDTKEPARKQKRTGYRVRDRVWTARGQGTIKYVFPRGPHGKNTYSVVLGNTRFGVVFNEDELAPVSDIIMLSLN